MEKKVFVLPFIETLRGYYEIEADNLEEAKAIVELGNFTETIEPSYKDGYTDWDSADLEERSN